MKINLPFHNKKNQPLPGGLCYLVTEKGQVSDSFSGGSRTSNLSETIDWHSNFRLASVSKQYTAAAILCCERQNKLSLSDRIGSYLPDLAPPLEEISIQQLLNHSSAIIEYETLISSNVKKQLTDGDVLSLIKSKGTTYFSPGSQFRYSNTGYCLLTQVIEKVCQMPFSTFMDEQLFQPNGLHTTTVFENGKTIPNRAYGFRHQLHHAFPADQNIMSATQGDGCIYTSPLAYSQWIQKLFSGKLIEGYSKILFGKSKVVVKDNVFYNMGWFLSHEKDGTSCVFHSGESTGFRNMVYYNPDKEKLILLFCHIAGKENFLEGLFDSLCHNHQFKYNLPSPVLSWLSKVYNP